jgi:hypothetical protein
MKLEGLGSSGTGKATSSNDLIRPFCMISAFASLDIHLLFCSHCLEPLSVNGDSIGRGILELLCVDVGG